MDDVVFFEAESIPAKRKIHVGLGLNNPQLEKWFEQSLKDYTEIEMMQLTGAHDEIHSMDALVILRRNRSGGMENPLPLVRRFAEIHPDGSILFILGTMDEEAKQIKKELQKLPCRVYIASVERGQMGSDIVKGQLEQMLKEWRTHETRVYQVIGVKGGCGVTTVVSHLSHHLAQQYRILVAERRESLRFRKLMDGIEVIQRDSLQTEEIDQYLKDYDYLILDDVDLESQRLDVKRIMVMDSSMESIEKTKHLPADAVILNRACISFLPVEVIENEVGKPLTMWIADEQPAFLQAELTGEVVIKEIENMV